MDLLFDMSALLSVDILLKTGTGIPSSHNIDEFRARPEDIALCQKWLANNELTCYKTAFGLVCVAKKKQLEDVFHVKIVGEGSNLQFARKPIIPKQIDAIIDQITVSRSPDLFA
ncbi:MAG: hypothetical protein AAGA02_14230 [Bacteroidota bacterium]